MSEINRRTFLGSAASGVAASMVLSNAVSAAPNDRVVVGVMGASRGRSLANSFSSQPNVQVKYICDVDLQRAESTAKGLTDKGHDTNPIQDFRKILDDKEVDALICAAPNHWHAPATILACAAGKHVYVEKPCSHNPQEGEWMIEAARKYNRAVQMGSQRRSGPGWIEAIQKLHEGIIGRVYLAKSWYTNLRPAIEAVEPSQPPSYLDYELWQGPAPRKPFLTSVVHYNWHWRWHWGNGELGNNGIHTLDLCRWGLGETDYPTRIVSSGGRYHFEDEQETPDTHIVAYEYASRKQITWECRSCNKHRMPFVVFYGDGGTMELDANGTHRTFDLADKMIREDKSSNQGDIEHIVNFLDAIRNDTPLELNAEIAIGHKSTMLCHLGNIAHRTGRTISCDTSTGHIKDDPDAMKFWQREYEEGWKPVV